MVSRFTTMEDLKMLQELIQIKVKQIRDRLNLLKARFKEKEQLSALASGVEESIHAVNVQTHYTDIDGLIQEYMELKQLHHETKAAQKISKEKKREDLAKCVAAIVAESRRRRAERDEPSLYNDSGDSSVTQRVVSGTESTISTGSSRRYSEGLSARMRF
ncbi:hypothetical protein L916_12923 [Phytophthora nicotianae]|uniref:Uncharacterized protein n=3 Tax=Phytophthora nicotianae TaxID=4792 RepID=V9ETP7_PHYNI|nr:hypothetical protein F443_13330 [Phytophthora nicotianae P1569]ETL34897.1 hypothetical protein L916_12923 [Phytophthora nicotianae]